MLIVVSLIVCLIPLCKLLVVLSVFETVFFAFLSFLGSQRRHLENVANEG